MKRSLLLFFPLLAMTLTTASIVMAEGGATDPRWIMEQVDARDDGDNMTVDSLMILIDKNDNERKREMKIFSKDKGRDTLKLIYFSAPADVKDTGFLTLTTTAARRTTTSGYICLTSERPSASQPLTNHLPSWAVIFPTRT